MPPFTGAPEAVEAAPHTQTRPVMAGLAAVARRFLGIDDHRPVGGVSRTRGSRASLPANMAVPVSAFEMVGLEAVKEKLGDRWPALAAKVHLIARNTISKHLIKGDVFEQQGDDGYLVLFASLGPVEAEFKSRVIAREISEHLLGAGEGEVAASVVCAQISAEALARGDFEGALSEALAHASRPPAAEPAESSPEDPAPGPSWEPVTTRQRAASQPQLAEVPPATAPTLERAYSPVWDVGQMTLLRYRSVARDSSPTSLATNLGFQADVALIKQVVEDLVALAARGRRLPIAIAVRQSSLGSGAQRAQLRHALAMCPSAQRRAITVEVRVEEDEFWTYACRAFAEMVEPLGIALAAMTPIEHPQAIPQGANRLRVVSTTLPPARDETETLKLMNAFAGRARALGLECAAHAIDSRALVLGAVGAGFRYLSGSAIHPEIPRLADAVRFEPLDLYRDIARRATTA